METKKNTSWSLNKIKRKADFKGINKTLIRNGEFQHMPLDFRSRTVLEVIMIRGSYWVFVFRNLFY